MIWSEVAQLTIGACPAMPEFRQAIPINFNSPSQRQSIHLALGRHCTENSSPVIIKETQINHRKKSLVVKVTLLVLSFTNFCDFF